MNPVSEQTFQIHADDDKAFQESQRVFNANQEEFNNAVLEELRPLRGELKPIVAVFTEGKSWTHARLRFWPCSTRH